MKLIILVLAFIEFLEAKPFFEHQRPDFGTNLGRRNEMGGDNGIGHGMGHQSGTGYGTNNGNGFANAATFESGMGPETAIVFENGMGPSDIRYPSNTGQGRGYGRQFSNGQEFGAQQFNKGASGFGSKAVKNVGGKHYHNIGAHHRKVTSIHQEEDNESHNIGGDSGFDTSAQSGGGFRNYQNGASKYGRQYGQGSEGIIF